jgi:hypothetical protein
MQSKKLYIFIGTEAELIKLFPVLLELASRMVPYDILASGQNELSNSSIVKEFKLPKPKKTLSSGGIKNTPVSLIQTAGGLIPIITSMMQGGPMPKNLSIRGFISAAGNKMEINQALNGVDASTFDQNAGAPQRILINQSV